MTNEEFQYAIRLLLNGNKDGLRLIYEKYIKLIYAIIYNTVGQKEDAEDITSEFFIKLVRVAPSYIIGSPHKAWLTTIAKNMAIDHIRKRSHEVTVLTDDEVGSDTDIIEREINKKSSFSLEDGAVIKHDMAVAMATLSPKEREIINLKLTGDLKFKEIAEYLNSPIGTVTWQYNQAIKKIRRFLSDYE